VTQINTNITSSILLFIECQER